MKKEKMNDKGFSLVELIIVIAIMAVLVVVLAPQYLKYVERSRNSTDLQNAPAAVTACQVYAAAVASADNGTKLAAETALDDAAIKLADLKCKSKTKWTTYIITGTVDTNGSLTFDYSCDGTPTTAFKDAMAGN